MLSRATGCAGVFLCLIVCACGFTPPQPAETIPVAAVINAIVCGLSSAVQQETIEHANDPSRPELLKGQVATVFLDLKIVDSTTLAANVGGSGTSNSGIISFSGGTLLPSLIASDAVTWTADSTINLPYTLDSFNPAVCKAAELDSQTDRYGFSRWLSDTLSSMSRVADISNTTKRTLTYDSNFGVTTGGGAGLKLVLYVVPLGLTANTSRNDVQHLRVTIGSTATPAPSASSPSISRFSGALTLSTPVPVSQVAPAE